MKKDTLYWIVNKEFTPDRYDLYEQLKRQTIRSLDSIQFYTELEKRSIKLRLKNVRDK